MHILEDRLKDFLSIVQGDKTGQLWDLVTCGNRQAGGQINCSVSFGQFQSGIASKLHVKSIHKSNIAQCVFDCSVVVSQDGLLYLITSVPGKWQFIAQSRCETSH